MGVDPEFRKFLMNAIKRRNAPRACFYAALPLHATCQPFDVVIMDMMQELAAIKSAVAGETFGSDVQQRILRTLYSHVGADPIGDDIVASQLVVACLDNIYQVPRNKAFVESSRDGVGHALPILTSTDAYDAVVKRAAMYAGETARDSARLRMSVASTDAAAKAAVDSFSDATQFLVTRGPFPADGSQIWRNVSLSWQLKRLVTEGVLTMNVPKGRYVLLDEGLPLTEAQYGPLRTQMLRDHGSASGETGNNISSHARAALVGHLMKSCLRRVLIAPNHAHRHLPVTGMGESDHKMLYYVQRRLPLGLNMAPGGRARYVVKCQDTDVMWQLLSHMRSLINPSTGMIDEVDVWLDTQTPQDRSSGTSREYRFIDVVELWRQVHEWLGEEFPSLRNPLETLLFGVFCNNNDYVERFPTHMKIGPATVWNTFMELLAMGSGRSQYPSNSGSPAKVTLIEPGLERLGFCMNSLMVCGERSIDRTDVSVDRTHVVERDPAALNVYDTPLFINTDTASRFFYALVQHSTSLKKVARMRGDKTWPITSGSYMGEARDLLEVVALLHVRETAGVMADNVKNVMIPPLFDIPTQPAMEARIARVLWTLNCYVNGWKMTAYTYSWFMHNGEYSQHGWNVTDITLAPHCHPDSQYLYAEYHPPVARTADDNPGDSDDETSPWKRVGYYKFLQPSMVDEVCKSGY
jgi:hypothetical protein